MGVGIKDVARVAGVSPATVSRVLGNGPVSGDLRVRVEEALRSTGYRPNLSARRLRSRESRTIGLIVADIRNPFFTALSRAVEDAAYGAGMRVILCNTDENPEREAMYLRFMQEERITGVIYVPTRATAETLHRLRFEFPVVLVDRSGPPDRYDAVVIDNRAAAAELVGHLAARGRRRIAGFFGNTSLTAVERREGYLAAIAAHGLTAEAHVIPPTAEAAATALAARLREDSPPDAWIASNSLILLGLLTALRDAGLRVPEDVAVAGFDNEAWTGLVGPGLTVIEQPVAEIGRTAMDLLFERLKRPEMPPRRVVLSGRMVMRGSTGGA